ncbi:hypothetical protein N7456_007404 [Penicillium angulare]|uniref:Uncharacterized protein n=1 Tax=Penicillium angulare TaxID=116970 RepID=A0A9W9FAL9_9EURO|nr:hypothetical protein N7456_007404 [Penicillium angulare]
MATIILEPTQQHIVCLRKIRLARTLRRIAETLGEQDDAEFAYYENAISRNIDDLHWDEKEQVQ